MMKALPMAIPEIPSLWNQILETLIAGPAAWQSPEQIASAIGRDPKTIGDTLALMDAAGWLEVWECPEPVEIRVTLTSWAASRLGVRLAEFGQDLGLRWIEIGQPEPAPRRARGVVVAGALEELDLVLDSLPEPDAFSAELDDEPSRNAQTPQLPTAKYGPTLLIGDRLTPWPGPDSTREKAGVCPACQGRQLSPRAYCLRCDRWGLDSTRSNRQPARRPARPRSVRNERASAQKLREIRKARRRARFQGRSPSRNQTE